MPISVLCPGCKTRFNVSDQFAGKEGPCPKCKAKIKVPAAPPPTQEVKVHTPEEFTSGGKTKTGAPSVKPISRQEMRIRPVPLAAGIAGTLAAFVAAYFLRGPLAEQIVLRGGLLFMISPLIVVAGYSFLRNDELEPFRGLALWVRAASASALFVGIWAGYYFGIGYIPADVATASYSWLYLWTPLVLVGGVVAWVAMELDYTNGVLLYAFYLFVTLALGGAAGLNMPWTAAVAPA